MMRLLVNWLSRSRPFPVVIEHPARTVSAYGTDARPVPRTVALACRGWDAGRGQG